MPLNRLVLRVDGAGRFISLLTLSLILTLILKKDFIRISLSKPLIIFGVWVVYAFINRLINGNFHDELPNYTFFTLIFVPYILMVTINYLSIKNFKRVINVLIFGLYLSLFILIMFNEKSSVDRLGWTVNSNTVGMMSTILLMFLYLKYFIKKISLLFLILLSIIPIITIITTGSRTAFGGLLLLIFTHFIINRSRSTLVTIVRFLIGIFLLLIPLNFVLHNTTLGERILSTTNQAEDGNKMETGNVILDKFGDRGVFYYMGWQVFIEKPIIGIGLNNYMTYVDGDQEQHSEYMIQLAELGIIGFLLFFSFYISVFRNLFRLKRSSIKQNRNEIYFFYTVIILAMITATRMYSTWYLFTVVGIVTGYITKENYSEKRLLNIFKVVKKNTNTNTPDRE